MKTPWRLVPRNLFAHKVRSTLTVLAAAIAMFLLCFVSSIVTSLENAVTEAAANRLVVQSAVSLFVSLPVDYQSKIDGVPGVEASTKFHWFGGYYQERANFLAEFAVDPEPFFGMYADDFDLVEGPDGRAGEGGGDAATVAAAVRAAMDTDRRACVIGSGLQDQFDWQVGDTIPIISPLYPKADGSAWDFTIVGVYEPRRANFDNRTVFFRWDYFRETWLAQDGELEVGAYMVNIEDGADPAQVIDVIDGFFDAGPQRTQTVTEAAFQAIFVSMMGNVPAFMGTIGGAIVVALLLSIVNTMSMAARQRRHDSGILHALGFDPGVLSRLFMAEAFLLSFVGGVAGVALAVTSVEGTRSALAGMVPTYDVETATALMGVGVSAVIGVIAGVGPAIAASRISPIDALRSEG